MEIAKRDLSALFSSFVLQSDLDLAMPGEADSDKHDMEEKSLDSNELFGSESLTEQSFMIDPSGVVNAAMLLKEEVIRLRKIVHDRSAQFKDLVSC